MRHNCGMIKALSLAESHSHLPKKKEKKDNNDDYIEKCNSRFFYNLLTALQTVS